MAPAERRGFAALAQPTQAQLGFVVARTPDSHPRRAALRAYAGA